MYGNIDVSLTRSPAHFGNKAGVGEGACREDREQLWKKRTAQQMVAALLQLRRGASAAELRERPEPHPSDAKRPPKTRSYPCKQNCTTSFRKTASDVEPRARRE